MSVVIGRCNSFVGTTLATLLYLRIETDNYLCHTTDATYQDATRTMAAPSLIFAATTVPRKNVATALAAPSSCFCAGDVAGCFVGDLVGSCLYYIAGDLVGVLAAVLLSVGTEHGCLVGSFEGAVCTATSGHQDTACPPTSLSSVAAFALEPPRRLV